jgi:aminopeptidase N
VLSEKFETITQTLNGVEVNYYYYDDENVNASFEYVKKSLEYFSKTFGAYPYLTYSVVQTKFIQGGMEFPALVMISDNLEQKSYGEVIVHETAHQWWQTCVGNNEIEYGFLDEGLAEYSVVLFYENHPEYGMDRAQMILSSEKTYKVFCSVYDKILGGVNTAMLRSLKDFSGEYEYVNIAYIKPCIMYDYLRTTIGEERFFKGLKNYYEKYCFKNVTPYDIVGVYEKLYADTNGFFESFYLGKAVI